MNLCHTYSHLFNLKTTGLRFFTVYGPWGRPDMALFLFTEAILNNRQIVVYNYGKMQRDFTYIDDVIKGIHQIIKRKRINNYGIYNIGNNSSVNLLDFIRTIEDKLNRKAKLNKLPIQPGDVKKTWANVDKLINDYNYHPKTKFVNGIGNFIDWYMNYYK